LFSSSLLPQPSLVSPARPPLGAFNPSFFNTPQVTVSSPITLLALFYPPHLFSLALRFLFTFQFLFIFLLPAFSVLLLVLLPRPLLILVSLQILIWLIDLPQTYLDLRLLRLFYQLPIS